MERNGHSTEDLRERVLFRRMGPRSTLRFLVRIKIERSGQEFISTVLPLEPGTVIAAGATPDEAEINAAGVFCTMVDHCLATDRLNEFIGDSQIMRTIDASLDDFLGSDSGIGECHHGHRHHSHDDHQANDVPEIPKPWFLGREYESGAESCEE